MLEKKAIITVIVPIYNDELYLRDALISIQNQTFQDFECVCVNDGSTDGSEEIINEFIQKDKRFIKINKQNGGVSSARNAGLDVATGEYIYLMDHDDLIPNYTLEKLLMTAKLYNADMARGRMMMIAENFQIENLPVSGNEDSKAKYFDNPLYDFYKHIRRKYKTWCYIWQCLFKASAIKEIRFLEELRAGGEDNLFMFDVVSNIKNFVQINDVVACHRYSKNSVTLNGFNFSLVKMFETVVPYVYEKYVISPETDKQLLFWVYRKQSYAVYRFLIRDTIRSNDKAYWVQSRDILLKMKNTPAFNEMYKRWDFRQKLFYNLFINERYHTLKRLSFMM